MFRKSEQWLAARPFARCRKTNLDFHVFVEWIDEIDVAGRDELMLNEDRGGWGFLLQDLQCQRDDFIPVTFRKVGHCADQARTGPAKFGTRVGNCVLTHDGAEMAATYFVEGAECGQCADIIDRADEGASAGSTAQVLAENFENLLKVTAAVQVRYGDRGKCY